MIWQALEYCSIAYYSDLYKDNESLGVWPVASGNSISLWKAHHYILHKHYDIITMDMSHKVQTYYAKPILRLPMQTHIHSYISRTLASLIDNMTTSLPYHPWQLILDPDNKSSNGTIHMALDQYLHLVGCYILSEYNIVE